MCIFYATCRFFFDTSDDDHVNSKWSTRVWSCSLIRHNPCLLAMGVIYPLQFAPLTSSSSHLRLHQGVVVVLDSYCQVLIALFRHRWQIVNCFFVICDDRCRGSASLSNDMIIIRQFMLADCIGLIWPFAKGLLWTYWADGFGPGAVDLVRSRAILFLML